MSGTNGLRILVHDYSGHPFQVQLSRELSAAATTSSIHIATRTSQGAAACMQSLARRSGSIRSPVANGSTSSGLSPGLSRSCGTADSWPARRGGTGQT